MSLLSGLLTLPVGYALQACKQVFHELPLEQNYFYTSEKIYKSDPRYARLLKNLPGSQVKSAMQEFLDKSGIRKDVVFIEAPNLGLCSGLGTNSSHKGDATILIAPGFYKVDKDACSWAIKHEISHIKYNDTFTIPLISCICQFVASIFGMTFLPFLPALGLAFTTGVISNAIVSQLREARADDFAIENGSDDELKGGRRFLIALKETNIEQRNTFWKRIQISASGDDRLDIFHPSLTSRVRKIEKALLARNVEIDAKIERQKINYELKIYVVNKIQEIEKLVKINGGTLGLLKQMFLLQT